MIPQTHPLRFFPGVSLQVKYQRPDSLLKQRVGLMVVHYITWRVILSLDADDAVCRNQEDVLKVEAKVELLRMEQCEIERALQSFQQYPAEAMEQTQQTEQTQHRSR